MSAAPREYVASLEATAAKHADHVALIDGERRITFAQLVDELGDRAQTLTAAGVKAGDRIVLVAENSADYLISLFATLKAGAVPATVYPSSGRGDLEYSITSADPVLVMVDDATVDTVRDVLPDGVPWVRVDGGFDVPAVRHDAAPTPELREPLYLICYSSGTTSRPKAIMLSSENMFNGIETYAEVWHLGEHDTTVVALPMAWMFGLATTTMATLLGGGTVVILRRARPDIILNAITTHSATFMPGVATMFSKLVEHIEGLDTKPDLSSLRLCISGGEPRNEKSFARWTKLTGCPVHDTFCSTECFPLITYDPIADPLPVPGSAGKLVPRSMMRVVDEHGADVAPGEVGEALANGPGMFLGYWNDEATSRAAVTEDGWYRQGDLVRVDEDGYVYVVGRLSDLIIRGGSNVSPAEVEAVLREHPSVQSIAIVGQPDAMYGERVVAAVVLAAGHELDASALKSFAKDRLSAFKVPSDYVTLAELPVNSTTGKVNRKAVAAQLDPAQG
ncbi:acyl--CoA ligase [Nocardioides sp. KIGAM211]|uniref:Acyl--CoA ligase n=1 Tax=Nocardioides luti TaxID=2761101 RepID=A0A7X0VBV6_9ACTN|nr:class I adenylate-forming enzyme family protein [Nocardioides luti]MBB6627583.1 acyl--CoA ligase [Nocardioides luti]